MDEPGSRLPKKPQPRPAPETLALIALGSNLGDSTTTVLRAIRALEALSPEPLLRSSLWESAPVDCPPGSPAFINAAVGLVPFPGETSESMLQHLQQLEKEFGRKPKAVVNEPRTLDLDIITFRRETRATTALSLPHPRAHLRRFVLEPLREIAPNFVLPGQTRTVAELLEHLPPDPSVRKKADQKQTQG